MNASNQVTRDHTAQILNLMFFGDNAGTVNNAQDLATKLNKQNDKTLRAIAGVKKTNDYILNNMKLVERYIGDNKVDKNQVSSEIFNVMPEVIKDIDETKRAYFSTSPTFIMDKAKAGLQSIDIKKAEKAKAPAPDNENKLKEMQAGLQTLKIQHAQALEDLEKANEDLKKTRASLTGGTENANDSQNTPNSLFKLKEDIVLREAKLDELKKKIGEQAAQLTQAKREIEDLKNDKNEKKTTIDNLKQEKTKLNQQLQAQKDAFDKQLK